MRGGELRRNCYSPLPDAEHFRININLGWEKLNNTTTGCTKSRGRRTSCEATTEVLQPVSGVLRALSGCNMVKEEASDL